MSPHFKHIKLLLAALAALSLSGCQSPSSISPPEEMPAASQSAFSSKDLIYFVVTDRFKDGSEANNGFSDVDPKNPKAYHGGDLAGLTQSLDYIQSLGATTVWITPVVKNETLGYHGYWAVDFENVDPHLGTKEELKTLVDEAHKRDMKIVLDYVVNHTGYTSPWLKDPAKADWFHPKKNISNWSDPKEVENNWLFGLPDLNTENPQVSQYFIDNAKAWIKETGIDGMRLDTARHVPRAFWKDFAAAIKADYPEFYLLGEVWSDNVRYMQLYNDDGLDGLTNYSLYQGISDTFSKSGNSSAMANALTKEKFFKNPGLNGIFIDNHDNPRYVTVSGKAYTKAALSFIMSYPAIPILYYGTEIGMEGKGDPDNRRDMVWAETQPGADNEMLNFYKQLAKLRKNNPALTEGQVTLIPSSKDVLVYQVIKDGSGVLAVINLRNRPLSETVPLSEESLFKPQLAPLLMEGSGQATLSGTTLSLELSPNQISFYSITQ